MIRYIIKRIIWMIPIIIGIAVLIFTIMHFVPGDPAEMILGSNATELELAAKRHQLGLDQPFLVQLTNYLSNLFFHFDFGKSYISEVDIKSEILARMPKTLTLGLCSMAISFTVGLSLGITAATHQNMWQDNICMVAALIGVSMPSFWLALLLVLLFAVKLNWLPASGIGGLKYYILPAIATAVGGTANLARQSRSSVLEVIRSDYVTTARAKGLKEKEVIFQHVLPNALIPVVTVLGTQFGNLLGGSLVIETIFSIPGMGSYMKSAINNRDYPIVQGCAVILGLAFSICMLLVDITYAFIDPRIMAQYQRKAKAKGKRV